MPRDPDGIGDSVRFAEERDPLGTSVHLALAMFFCASIALSTAMTSVSFVLLIGYTLLRLPNLWRALAPLAASPLVWLWLGWTAWTALNAFWSADLERWRDSLGSFWCVALLPTLFPLARHWRLLLGAFVAGTAVQAGVQVAQAFGFHQVPITWTGRLPGIGSHPGHVTTSAAITLVLVLTWMREARRTGTLVAAAVAIGLAGVSIVLAAGRGGILATGLGSLVAGGSLAWRFGIPWRSGRLRLALLAAVVAIGGLAWLTSTGRGPASFRFQLQDLQADEPERMSSVEARYLWWGVSLDAFLEHPVRGIGTGSLYSFSERNARVARMSEEKDMPVETLAARHPHSVYMLIAAEQGVIGLAWLGGVVLATLAAAWQATAIRPVACGVFAGLVVWLGSAAFDCLNLPLRTASMFMLLTAVVALPRGRGVGLDRWTGETAGR